MASETPKRVPTPDSDLKYAAILDQLSSLKTKERNLRKNLDRAKAKQEELERELASINQSLFWRLGSPFRAIARITARFSSTQPVKPTQIAKSLEAKLWGGFSSQALRDLSDLDQSESASEADRSAARWALANWALSRREFETASDYFAKLRSSGVVPSFAQLLSEAACATATGNYAAARKLLTDNRASFEDDANFNLALANTYMAADMAADDVRLEHINAIYKSAGIASLQKINPALPLSARNLATAATTPADAAAAKVTVIIPAYDAEHTLSLALDSLLAQTWTNLEIIIVDDFSKDGTVAAAEAYARADPRVIVIRQPKNQGSYTARNRALQVATGDFITVHDSGDWSHPQKIEIQVSQLLRTPEAIGNFSNWARVHDDLFFAGKARHKERLIDWNPSSFMFRRELLDHVGGWIPVRISADAELVRRARKVLPDRSIPNAFELAPLAFGVDDDASLTKNPRTHGRTIYHGFRREFREASDHWLATSKPEDLKVQLGAPCPFPVPGPILPDREDIVGCDTIVIADFNAPTDLVHAAISALETAVAQKHNVAVLHWPHYTSDVTQRLDSAIRKMSQRGEIRVVSPGEKVTARKLIVAHPVALQNEIDLRPEIKASDIIALDDDVARQHYAESGVSVDRDAARASLKRLFGSEGRWLSTTGVLRAIIDG